MTMKYKLIAPTPEIIEQYNSFWNATEGKPGNWLVTLFQGQGVSDIRDNISQEELEECGVNDSEILALQNKEDVGAFLKKINAVYHTRIAAEPIANNLSWASLKEMEFDTFVARCKTYARKSAYSFASKVFSFLKSDEYPIIDSITATLLARYLEDAGKMPDHAPKSSWGKYKNYKDAYDVFREHYRLEDFTYKQIDIFLWTYGKALQSYWRKEGVLSFASVSYLASSK